MILGINKPVGITSHDVVEKVRRITGEARVGHGGTLDPFADGVLVIGITRESTKKLHDILKNTDKEYLAVVELGKTSTTGDPEGKISISTKNKAVLDITKDGLLDTLLNFTGELQQRPPQHSAIKVGGIPAYKLARAGKKAYLKKRTIYVKELELIEFELPIITLRLVVSSGTYIRSLAEDIGAALGVGAYLKKLTRTAVGSFTLGKSLTLQELKETIRPHT